MAKKDEVKERSLNVDMFKQVFFKILNEAKEWQQKGQEFAALVDAVKGDCQELGKATQDLVYQYFELYYKLYPAVEAILTGKENTSRALLSEKEQYLAQKMANELGID